MPGLLEIITDRLDRLEHELDVLRTVPTDPSQIWGDGAMRLVDAARFSGISRSELYLRMNRGELPFSCTGRHRLVPRRWLVQWLQRTSESHEELS